MKNNPQFERLNLNQKILTIAGVFFLLPNIIYVYLGWFVRLRADDFCFSGTLRQFGFFEGLSVFYRTLSNRFSAFMVWSFSDIFGEMGIRFFIMVAIALYSFAIFYTAKTIFRNLRKSFSIALAFFISQSLTFFSLYLAPNIHQGVYWRAAMVHYFLSIPLLVFFLHFVVNRPKDKKRIYLSAILIFIISIFMAGLSESYAGLHGGVFALLFLYRLVNPDKKNNQHLLAYSLSAIFGVLITLLIMIVSPGNTLKFALEDQAASLLSIILIALDSAFSFIFYSLRGLWLPTGILLVLGYLSGWLYLSVNSSKLSKQNTLLAVVLIPLVVFFLIFCISAPTAYGMMAYPEKRVLMLAMPVLLLGIFSEGVLIAFLIPQKLYDNKSLSLAAIILILVISIYPFSAYRSLFNMVNGYRTRARLWDSQQEEIFQQIAQGEKDLTVTALDSFSEMAEMRDYDTFWVNLCVAQYYNVNTVSAVER